MNVKSVTNGKGISTHNFINYYMNYIYVNYISG